MAKNVENGKLGNDDSCDDQLPQHALVPEWCNVLEGMSDEDVAELAELFEFPVRLAR